MDMNTAFDLNTQHDCPSPVAVHYPLHVMFRFDREVIDRVRGGRANQLC